MIPSLKPRPVGIQGFISRAPVMSTFFRSPRAVGALRSAEGRAWRLRTAACSPAALVPPSYKSRDYTLAARQAPPVEQNDVGPDDTEFPTAFGMEMEFDYTHVSHAQDVVAAVLGAGSTLHGDGVVDAAGRLWEVKPDEGTVVEIASPVLRTMGELRQVQDIAQAIRAGGARSHAGCGTHFHIDARGMEMPHMLRLIGLLARHEQPLYKALGVHAERGRYCMPMQRKNIVALLRHSPASAEQLCKLYRGPVAERDRGLNLENLRNRGSKVTLEFRYFNGTLNAHLLGCYAGLVMGLTRYARASRQLPTRGDIMGQPSLPLLLADIGMPPAHPVATYLIGQMLAAPPVRRV